MRLFTALPLDACERRLKLRCDEIWSPEGSRFGQGLILGSWFLIFRRTGYHTLFQPWLLGCLSSSGADHTRIIGHVLPNPLGVTLIIAVLILLLVAAGWRDPLSLLFGLIFIGVMAGGFATSRSDPAWLHDFLRQTFDAREG